jgi:hypothetical protein
MEASDSEDDSIADSTNPSESASQQHITDLHAALRSQHGLIESLRALVIETRSARQVDEGNLRLQEIEAYLHDRRNETRREFALRLLEPGSLRAEYLDLAQKLPLTLADVKRSSWTTHDQRMFNKPEDDKKRKLWCVRRERSYHRQLIERTGNRNSRVQFLLSTLRGWFTRNMHPKEVLREALAAEDAVCSDTVLDSVEKELEDWIPPTSFQWDDESLVVLLFDNLDMYKRVSFARHTDADTALQNSMHHSIVSARILVDRSKLKGPAPTGSLYREEFDITTCLPSQKEVLEWLQPMWTTCVEKARLGSGIELLARPPASEDRQRSGKTIVVSLPIMTDKQASKKEDVAEAVLRHLQRYPKAKAVVFILDYQTYIIFHWLKFTMGDVLIRAFALGGGFHRSIASVDAMNRLFNATLFEPAAIMLLRKDVKQDFKAKEYNTVEQFQRMFAVAAFEYLAEVDGIPDDVLADPRKLLKAVDQNLEARELVGFLTYGGTFLIQDKVSVQTGHSENIDKAWTYNTILCRATGKTNYAKGGVIQAKNQYDSHEWIKNWREDTPTFRESDSLCVGRYHDIAIERKVWLHKDPVTIPSAIKLKEVNHAATAKECGNSAYKEYIGIHEYKHRKKAISVDEDILILKETMRSTIGSSFEQLCKKKTYSDWAARGFTRAELGVERLEGAWLGAQDWLNKLVISPTDNPRDAEIYEPPEVVDLTLDDNDVEADDLQPPKCNGKDEKWYDLAAISWCKGHTAKGEEETDRQNRVKSLMTRNKERHRKLWEARSEATALAEEREAEEAIKAVARAEKAAEKVYEVSHIRGRRVVEDELQYRVQFAGYDPRKHNKWIPASELESCTVLIAKFEKQYKTPRKQPGSTKNKQTAYPKPTPKPKKKKK